MSLYVINDGGGGRGLGSSTCLDQEGLETTNNIGGYEFFEDVVAACLEVVYGSFQREDGSASGKVMAKTGDSGGVSS